MSSTCSELQARIAELEREIAALRSPPVAVPEPRAPGRRGFRGNLDFLDRIRNFPGDSDGVSVALDRALETP